MQGCVRDPGVDLGRLLDTGAQLSNTEHLTNRCYAIDVNPSVPLDSFTSEGLEEGYPWQP